MVVEVVVAILGRGALMRSLGVDARDLIDARIDGGLSAIDRETGRREGRQPERNRSQPGNLPSRVYVGKLKIELRRCNRISREQKTATAVGAMGSLAACSSQ